MNLSQSDRKRILTKVSHLVKKKHFNPSLNGANWDELVAQQLEGIVEADNTDIFEQRMQKLVAGLRTSHTGFYHKTGRAIPARHAINATLKRCEIDGVERWVFQDVHEGGAASAAQIGPGDILLRINDEKTMPPIEPVFRMGSDVALTIRKRDGRSLCINLRTPNPLSRERPIAQPQPLSISKLEPRLAYLKIRIFPGAVGIDFAAEIDKAIRQIADCDRLIVDLRGNTGGGIGGLRLMSYLTPDKRQIGYSLTSRRAREGYARESLRCFGKIPSRKIALLWLAVRYGIGDHSICLVTEGLGSQPFQGRVVILVNEHSASSAEIITAFAKENHLATIVGTKTAGRLLSGSAFHVGKGFMLGLPVAAYHTWEGQLLEGSGVTPDFELAWDCSANSEHDLQLQQAITIVKRL